MNGYVGEKAIVISNFEKEDIKWLGPRLKIWADRYPCKAETKLSKEFVEM